MSQPQKQNFLHGAAILAFGVVIMKILGAIYKIPLRNIIGETGYGYFFAAYTIYNFFLTISTAGLPVALSRMNINKVEGVSGVWAGQQVEYTDAELTLTFLENRLLSVSGSFQS